MTLTLPQWVDPRKAASYGEKWDWSAQYKLEDFDLDLELFEPRSIILL